MQFGGFQPTGFGFNNPGTSINTHQAAPPTWQGSFGGFKPAQTQPANTGFFNSPPSVSRGFQQAQPAQIASSIPSRKQSKPFASTDRKPNSRSKPSSDQPMSFGGFGAITNTPGPQGGFGAVTSGGFADTSSGFKATSQVARSTSLPNAGFAVPKPVGFQNIQQTPSTGFGKVISSAGFSPISTGFKTEESGEEQFNRGGRRGRGRAVVSRGRGRPVEHSQFEQQETPSFKPEFTSNIPRGFHTQPAQQNVSSGFKPELSSNISRGFQARSDQKAEMSRNIPRGFHTRSDQKAELSSNIPRGFHTRPTQDTAHVPRGFHSRGARDGFIPRGRDGKRVFRGSSISEREQDFRKKALASIQRPSRKDWNEIEREESPQESIEDVDLDQELSDNESAELSDGKIANEEDLTSDEDIEVSQEPQESQESEEEPTVKPLNTTTQVSSRLQRFAKSTESISRGNISEMCTSTEALRREDSHTLNIFEISPNTDLASTHKPQVYLPWAIKEYMRSAPDTKDTARDPQALTSTLDYLISNILDVDTDGNPLHYTLPSGEISHKFSHIYDFISNRVRAIAKDYKILGNTTTDSYVNDHERIARFLILSCVEGVGQEDFDSKLNADRIKDILVTCLHHSYRERKELGLSNQNEAEFVAYSILYNLRSPIEVQMWIRDISPDLYTHPYIKYAISAFIAFNTNNFVKYFEIAREAPYLISCLMYLYFDSMRTDALRALKKAVRDIDLEYLIKILWFSDQEEALEYLYERGVSLKQQDSTWEINFQETQIQTDSYKPSAAPKNILSKRTESRKQIIQGQVFLPVISPKPAPVIMPKPIPTPALNSSDYFDTLVNEYIKELALDASYDIVFNKLTEVILSEIVESYKPTPMPETQPVVKPVTVPMIEVKPVAAVVKQAINKWVFPDTEDKLSEIVDNFEKDAFKNTVNKYKRTKKQQKEIAKQKSKLSKLRFISLYFRSWKQYNFRRKFKKYSKNRIQAELTKFTSQFSKVKDWDYDKQNLITKIARTWAILERTPEVTLKDLLRLKEENSRLYYKLSIVSLSSNVLIDKASKYFEPKLSELQSSHFYVNFNISNLQGSDLVICILYSEDISHFNFSSLPYSHIHLILIDSEIDRKYLQSKLLDTHCREIQAVFSTEDEVNKTSIYDHRLYNFILYPLTQSLQEDPNPVWENLQTHNSYFLDSMFEEVFLKSNANTKEILLDPRYSSAHTWIQRVNSLVRHIESTYFSMFYTQEPPFEALEQIFKVEVSSFEEARNHYSYVRSLIQALAFKPMPVEVKTSSKHLQGYLYAYAAETIAIYDLCLPGYASRLLKSLDEIFANEPVRFKGELIVPWTQYFVTIISLKLGCIHELAGKWVWDSAQSPPILSHFEDNIEDAFSNYDIHISDSQPFNDILSKAIFDAILDQTKLIIQENSTVKQPISTPSKPDRPKSTKLFPELLKQYSKEKTTPIKRPRSRAPEDSGPYKIPKSLSRPNFRLNFISEEDETETDPVWRLIEESKRVREEASIIVSK